MLTVVNLPAGDLQDAFARVAHSMSNEETRYYLRGAHIHKVPDGVLVQSTDGHRLTRVKIKADDLPDFADFIISRDCVASVRKSIKRRHSHFSATIVLGDESKILLPGNVELPLEFVDGTFPDADRVIPSLEDKKTVTVLKEDFIKAVDAVHGFASGAGHDSLKLSFKDNKLTISARADSGAASFEIECGCDALDGPFEIGFNGQYLKEFAKRIDSNGIAIHLSDPGSPTRFSGVGYADEHETFVLMPIRV